jgi:NADH dehydrogenase
VKPRILILGGGFAGMFTARELRRSLGFSAHIELINDQNYFVFQPLLPEVGAGSITALHAVSPLRFLLRGIFVRKARVESVDFDRKVVTVFQGVQRRPTEVPYDHLVIALGQSVDLSRTPGLTEHAMTMKTLDDARRLRSHIIERLEHAEITGLPEVKQEALTFCVVGGGFSGVETVGEMKELIDRSLKYYPNISASEIRVIVLEFAPRILNELPESLAIYASEHLRKRGIEVKLKTGVASATGTQLVTTTGEVIGTRTIVATIGNAPSPVVRDMALDLEQGRIPVDRTLAATGAKHVWSLGDCALIPMKDGATERQDFAPPTAQFAVREARHLARNIKAALEGTPLKPFNYKSKGALASLGARRGVAQIYGINITGFVAWLLWRAYYIMFLPGIATRLRVLINWIMDGLSPRSVVQVSSYVQPAARYVMYRAGDRIYEDGNRADGFYTVISGKVSVSHVAEGGEIVEKEVGPGGHFGERLILGEARRSRTVRALEDTRVLVLDREEFLKIADGFGAFRRYFEQYIEDSVGRKWTPDPDIHLKTSAEPPEK